MRDPIHQALERSDVLILDGAMGTELERRGRRLDDPLWSARALIEAPDLIAQVHRDYLMAGAGVIVTASYQASVEGFVSAGVDVREAAALIARAARIAVRTRDEVWAALDDAERGRRVRPIVAGGLGPYGAFLADGSEFRGDYPLDTRRIADFHRPRIEALLEGGAQMLAFETVPSRGEAEILLDVMERDFPDAVAWVAFSARDGARISDGEAVETAVAALAARPSLAAVGINCTAPEHIAELIGRIASVMAKPIVVYPNAGGAWDSAAHAWREEPHAGLLPALAPSWRAAGARLIGGCCRTTPADIAALAAVSRPPHAPAPQPGIKATL
jgi:homocysteine S-methyltransferase